MSIVEYVGVPHEAIHNMSVPPRSIVDVRPMGNPKKNAGAEPRLDTDGAPLREKAGASATSARHLARVCLVGLFYDGQSHLPCGRDIAKLVDGLAHELADAVALLRLGTVEGEPFAAMGASCLKLPVPELLDEFLDRVAALGLMDLPPLLLATRFDADAPAPPGSPLPPLKVLRLLAGTAGGLFLRDRRPSASLFLTGLPGGADESHGSFDYYLPIAPQRGEMR